MVVIFKIMRIYTCLKMITDNARIISLLVKSPVICHFEYDKGFRNA